MPLRSALPWIAAVAMIAGCNDPPRSDSAPDTRSRADASLGRDSGLHRDAVPRLDSGNIPPADGGADRDVAGAIDAGGDLDAGAGVDAPRSMDATPIDARVDAGSSDTGARDSGPGDGGPRDTGTRDTGGGVGDAGVNPRRGFPAGAPWVSFYGTAQDMGNLSRVASTFRVINIDADPDQGNFTPAQITTLKNNGQNKVISYLNFGSCEDWRDYWRTVPSGFVSCEDNTAAHRGPYYGYPDETWMDVGNSDYQHLMVDHVAARLVAQGIDGFFLDNMEMVEHGPNSNNGPCNASCRQGGLDLVKRLRDRFPDMLIVMQNATSDVTRLGVTGGVPFRSLLDGISHEEVYEPQYDQQAEMELIAWRNMMLRAGAHPFWIATEDYVGDCSNATDARSAYMRSRAQGFSPYATDASGGQFVVCYWSF